MRRETQASINDWCLRTFGVAGNPVALRRLIEETAELAEAVAMGRARDIATEAADVAILLYRLAGVAGFDLDHEIDRKMAINRGRRWESNGDGSGRHVEEKGRARKP